MQGKSRILFVYPNPPMLGVMPSSIAILSSVVRQAGHEVELFDASLFRHEDKVQDEERAKLNHVKASPIDEYVKLKDDNVYDAFRKHVERFRPDIIGITIVDNTMLLARDLIRHIRKTYDGFIIAGGVTPTFAPERIFEEMPINAICIGEGEGAMVELCDALASGGEIENIRNLAFPNPDGTIRRNPIRKLVDINTLPYADFSVFDPMRFYRPFHGNVVRMLPMDLDRGCPFSCTYCAAPALRAFYNEHKAGAYCRRKDTERIISELKHFMDAYDANFIWFSSETFLAEGKDKFSHFAERYMSEINLPFWCQTRLDTITDEKAELLSKMGCKSVSVGLEHGSEPIRRQLLKKKISNEQIYRAVRILAKYDIPVTVNSIMGFPGERREDIMETMRVNRTIHGMAAEGSSVNCFIFSPYLGTPLRQMCLEKGYLKNERDIPSMYADSVLEMPSISADEIKAFKDLFPYWVKLPEHHLPELESLIVNGGPTPDDMDRLTSYMSQ